MCEHIFRRHELKFLLNEEQRAAVEAAFAGTMVPDAHGESTICNVYYDTADYRLIRRSLEKPVYKEKLRLRSYGSAGPDSTVFLELKKKYDGVVYKRRIELKEQEARDCLDSGEPLPDESQIGREIDYFRRFYGRLRPSVYLCYDRTAFFSRESADLRVTFDRNILWRQQSMTLCAPAGGRPILLPDQSLMEIKAADAIPFWLVELMSRNAIRQTTFSKYGEAYQTILAESMTDKGGRRHVR